MTQEEELKRLKERKEKAELLPLEELCKYLPEYLKICNRIKEIEEKGKRDYSVLGRYANKGIIKSLNESNLPPSYLVDSIAKLFKNTHKNAIKFGEYQELIFLLEKHGYITRELKW